MTQKWPSLMRARWQYLIRSPYTFGFAAVHGIRIDGGKFDGGADPGHDGIAIAV
jgi:gamma-glutamyltranspeptidase / glutathione hydrolase